MSLDTALLDILRCPDEHHAVLTYDADAQTLTCTECRRVFDIRDGIPVLLLDEARGPATEADSTATGADGLATEADSTATGADGLATEADGTATGADGPATDADGTATGADGPATEADGSQARRTETDGTAG